MPLRAIERREIELKLRESVHPPTGARESLCKILSYLSFWCATALFRPVKSTPKSAYDSIATVGEIRVYRRADFQSGSRVLKKVF